MNKDINDIQFGSTQEEMVLEDFIARTEPVQADLTDIIGKTYCKIREEKRRKRQRKLFAVAAVVLPLFFFTAVGVVMLQRRGSTTAEQHVAEAQRTVIHRVEVPVGETLHLLLSDGSKVIANSRTRITYPNVFTGRARDIYIKGEAYLEVAHNAARPFVIHTGGFDVRVLGTRFCIDNYDEKDADVVLVEGSVEVLTRNNDRVRMSPDERLSLSNGQFIARERVNTDDYICRARGIVSLHGDELQTVVNKLGHYYGKHFIVDRALRKQKLYGKLLVKDTAERVIANLCSIADAKAFSKGDVVTLKQKRRQ